jgi:hypothetical protein
LYIFTLKENSCLLAGFYTGINPKSILVKSSEVLIDLHVKYCFILLMQNLPCSLVSVCPELSALGQRALAVLNLCAPSDVIVSPRPVLQLSLVLEPTAVLIGWLCRTKVNTRLVAGSGSLAHVGESNTLSGSDFNR